MNTVCPGFVPHHVKPNRCRRCFKDVHDHDSSNEVTTSFTLPLPRRRRESVAVTETPKAEENTPTETSASFTITETTSLGRRTRQRSSSTSSWFQEKKVDEEHREKIDSLFRNADDSRASYRGVESPDSQSVDTVAVIRLPDSARRVRYTGSKDRVPLDRTTGESSTIDSKSSIIQKVKENSSIESKPSSEKPFDVKLRSARTVVEKDDKSPSKPPELPPKTLENRFDFLKRTDAKTVDKNDAEGKISVDKFSKFGGTKTSGSDSLNRSSSFRSKFESQKESSTSSDSKLVTEKKPLESRIESQNERSTTSDSKPIPEKKPETKFESQKEISSVSESKSIPEKKPFESKFGERKPVETKFGAVRLRDTKFSELRSRASKFETPTTESKFKDVLSKPSEIKSAKTEDAKLKDSTTVASKTTDIKPKDSKPEISTPVESKPKEALKPVLARFGGLKSAEPVSKPSFVVPTPKPIGAATPPKPTLTTTSKTSVGTAKPTTATKPKEPSSSSEEESESESEESDEPASKPMPAESAKADEKKSTSTSSAPLVKKVESVEVSQVSSKAQKEQENKMKELQNTLDQLKKKLKTSEDTIKKLEREKSDQQKKQQTLLDKDKESLEKTSLEISKLRSKLAEIQSSQEDIQNENKKIKQELKDHKQELKDSKQELKDTKQELNKAKQDLSKKEAELSKKDSELAKKEAEFAKKETVPEKSKPVVEQLKQKLSQSEALCEELMEENEEIKKEVRDLEQELEELHDNFREDQASEFRGLKKELETATKNCRVLQFKLRKAEKKCELLELDRHSLEDKVREYQSAVRQDVDRSKLKELEKELSLSKNLTSSLNRELEEVKEALLRSDAENEVLRQQQQQTGGLVRSATPTSQSRLSPVIGLLGKEHAETLSRELQDTMERESDLREQLKFSEEEAKQARRKIGNLEQENETLMLQIKKLTNVVRSRTKAKDNDAEEEEVSAENLKIQLDLQEQEMGVLRRKLDDTEKENENLQSEVKYLQEKVINQPLIELPELPKDAGSPGMYWENKVRLQEYEIRETRKKLIEKDREIERLHTEVEIYRKKASKMMVRSRSLDSDIQVDLKRQLQLVEQEATMLRQKVNSLEAENEKLITENKRMTLRLSKKPPPSSADIQQMENMELKEKLEQQQRKLEAMKVELEKAASENPVAILQDYKPRRESLTSLDSETDLIASLKKRLKSKDDELQTFQLKASQLEAENSRLSREYKKLKDSLGIRKRPAKAVRDSATRQELREIVSELQDEISELQVNLRSREVVQEDLEAELERIRKELRETVKDLKQKEEKLQLEVDRGKYEKEALQKEVETQKNRATTAEDQLHQVSRSGGANVAEQSRQLSQLRLERDDADRRARAAEEALEKKTQRLRDTQEKLNATAALKEEMARSNRSLETQKTDIEKELEEHRGLLVKAEARAAELRSQVDKTDRDLTSLRKECNQLRNELEDERSRLKQTADKRQTDLDSTWNREREDLRRTINDLRNRNEQLQQQITENEKIFIEKEARLRDDFKRKKEAAVREAREKGEAAVELVKEEEKILRNKMQELSDKLEKTEYSLRETSERMRKAASEHRREREEWEQERDRLESELRQAEKRRERAEREQEQQLRMRDEEVLQAKERVVALEREQRRMQMRVEEADELERRLKGADADLAKMRDEYEHLTTRYDQLEDDFVKTKAGLVQEKEDAESSVVKLKRELNELTFEITTTKETYNSRQDTWIKEKLDLQERTKELSRRLERLKSVEQERRRLQELVDEKEALIETCKKQEKLLREENDRLRKKAEEVGKALDRPSALPASASGREFLGDAEARMALMSSEMVSMQAQIAALASERDELKARLSAEERSSEEARTGSLKRERARHREEADAARRKVQELRYQLEDVREQLDDSQLENKNLKLQIETDKNAFEIQIAELKSKINQLEEQKILESTRGQTRNIAKTRLELTWEKERGELQHLLAESQRLVVELRSRVERAETEHEKERQAVRRQMLEMRGAAEKERTDGRRKMSELHSSLLEIRESHAKLRGLSDRMKKEREILLKEREEWRQRLQAAQQLHTRAKEMEQHIEKVASEISANEGKTNLSADFKDTVLKVKDNLAELLKCASVLKDDERLKRTTSFRRAVSAQEVNDPIQRWSNPQRVTDYPLAPPSMIIRPPPRQKTLQRKSLSLDHTFVGGSRRDQRNLKIWESEGESVTSTPAGSLLSLGGYGYDTDSSMPDSEYRYGGITRGSRHYRPPSGMTTDSEAAFSSREGSVDPGGSAESVPLATQHQKKSFKDKLKMLRKAKSIDVSTGRKVGSEESPYSKAEKEQSLRSKISKVLKKPLGRSFSMETHKPAPALPPKGVVPDVVPSRPTAQKPLSSSRGDLSTSSKPSSQQKKKSKSSKSGVETPV